MIPEKIQALFNFIDYLDGKKPEYIEQYLPLCSELIELGAKRSELKPDRNYKEKQQYDQVQSEISLKFDPIYQNICIPVLNRLQELGIWAGDDAYTSIWNSNIPAISDFKKTFATEDIQPVMDYKQKYLAFRIETNSHFLCLQFVFQELDELLKQLFDFFKDTDENEFRSFETEIIEVGSMEEAIKEFVEAKGKNVSFTFPNKDLLSGLREATPQPVPQNIINELIMGDKIQIGDIKNNSGQIIVGKDIRISDSMNERKETIEKIAALITQIRQQAGMDNEDAQTLITNFDKVKEELAEEKPSATNIFKWLSTTRVVLKNLVFSHEITEAIKWVYESLNFIF